MKRRLTPEQYEAIGAKYLPPGIAVNYRRNLTGRAEHGSYPRLSAPRPRTPDSLYIWLHECAHFALGHGGPRRKTLKSYQMEYEAETWAQATMRAEGVPVSEKMRTRAQEYVAYKICKGVLSGAKQIDPKVLRWVGAEAMEKFALGYGVQVDLRTGKAHRSAAKRGPATVVYYRHGEIAKVVRDGEDVTSFGNIGEVLFGRHRDWLFSQAKPGERPHDVLKRVGVCPVWLAQRAAPDETLRACAVRLDVPQPQEWAKKAKK